MPFIQSKLALILSAALLLSSPLHAALHPASAVTYDLSGGRLGDNLLSLAHAKWVSYCLKRPLVYRHFALAEQLTLSSDPSVMRQEDNVYEKLCTLSSREEYQDFWNTCWSHQLEPPTLITVPYFPETPQEYDAKNCFPMQTLVNWDDSLFIQELRALIQPLHPLPAFNLPVDQMSVAIHIRQGEDAKFDKKWPMKAPPLNYYFDALQWILEILKQPLYVFIFTDHPTPAELCQNFAARFSDQRATFHCHNPDSAKQVSALEDFFAMGKFDCLIRADSNFSLIASKIFPYKIVISPLRFLFVSNKKNRFRPPNEQDVLIDRFLLQVAPPDGSLPMRTIIRKSPTYQK